MDEVINRWHQLYSGFALSQRYLSGATLGKAELATLNDEAEIWRERLMNVSWLMRTVNKRIARQANADRSGKAKKSARSFLCKKQVEF